MRGTRVRDIYLRLVESGGIPAIPRESGTQVGGEPRRRRDDREIQSKRIRPSQSVGVDKHKRVTSHIGIRVNTCCLAHRVTFHIATKRRTVVTKAIAPKAGLHIVVLAGEPEVKR